MKKKWIYLSPHFDDAVLSCGGLIYQQIQAGDVVQIWTVMGSQPDASQVLPPFAQALHAEWQTDLDTVAQRQKEDIAACEVLGATYKHLQWHDVIYRRHETGEPVVNGKDDLFAGASEPALVDQIGAYLLQKVPARCRLISPLAIGNHVDHCTVVAAVDKTTLPHWHYVDYPYIAGDFQAQAGLLNGSLKRISKTIGENGLKAWLDAISCYTSQLRTFWRDDPEMILAIANYQAGGGGMIWK